MDIALLHEYGMVAFGLFVFLVVWKVVVEPTLKVLNDIVEKLSDQDATSKLHTAMLNKIAERLERMEEKYDKREKETH